jgi:hypothetical protein
MENPENPAEDHHNDDDDADDDGGAHENIAAILPLARREERWLEVARDDFLQSLPVEDKGNPYNFCFPWCHLQTIAADTTNTLVEAWRVALTDRKVNLLQFYGGVDDFMTRENNGLAPPLNQALLDACINIGRMLGTLPDLKVLHIIEKMYAIPLSEALVADCRQLCELNIRAHGDRSVDTQVESLARSLHLHPNVEKLELEYFDKPELRLLMPMVQMLPKLNRLEIYVNQPLVFSTSSDTDMIREIFGNDTLQRMLLHAINLVTQVTVEAFCCSVKASSNKYLRVNSFQCLESEHATVAKMFVNSPLTRLKLHSFFSPVFLAAFLEALLTSQTCVLERLFFEHAQLPTPLIDYNEGLVSSDDPTNIVSPDWVRQVSRALDMNCERRTCAPLFAAIRDAGDDERCKLLVDAAQVVSLPILFEHILQNENDLQGLIVKSSSIHELGGVEA